MVVAFDSNARQPGIADRSIGDIYPFLCIRSVINRISKKDITDAKRKSWRRKNPNTNRLSTCAKMTLPRNFSARKIFCVNSKARAIDEKFFIGKDFAVARRQVAVYLRQKTREPAKGLRKFSASTRTRRDPRADSKARRTFLH